MITSSRLSDKVRYVHVVHSTITAKFFSTVSALQRPKMSNTNIFPWFPLFVCVRIIVVDCGFPTRPRNGSYIGNTTTFQSLLRFKCDEGFELQGSETRMCTSDKNWSGKDVTCRGKFNAVMC